DGLRFVAFLLVFIHHLPPPQGSPFAVFARVGWFGVEIFFVLSAFLLFQLFQREHEKRGSIDVPTFYLRRVLRLYPLMVVFPLLMIAIFGLGKGGIARLYGQLFFVDNALTAIRGPGTNIPHTGHLWTLSYEFQIYLVLPLAFIMRVSMSLRAFCILLAALWLTCLGARLAFVLAQAHHPYIWVTPFLRPESTLIGIAIAVGALDRVPIWVVVAAGVFAAAALIHDPAVDVINAWTLAIYPVAALIAAALLILALRVPLVVRVLSLPPIRFLGQISYGLYVVHFLFATHFAVN